MDEYKGDEPKLTYAIEQSSNKLVYIKDVKSGLNCNCVCPECFKPLIARKGDVRQPHFAHYENSNCSGGIMSVIHLLSEEIIEEEKEVMFPAGYGFKAEKCSFDEVILEQRTERNDLQPDVVGISKYDDREVKWNIEILYTHEVDKTKRKKIRESKINCLEIDVNGQTQDKESLKEFLLNSSDNRKWINNPEYKRRKLDKRTEKIRLVEKILRNKDGITLPPYTKYGIKEKHIILTDIQRTFVSEDGSFCVVEGNAGGKKYIFRIGYSNSYVDMETKKEHPELSIVVNNRTTLSNLKMEWIYNSEHEEKKKLLEKIRKECNFEMVNTVECNRSKCEFYQDECPYHFRDITYLGVNYVLCTRE